MYYDIRIKGVDRVSRNLNKYTAELPKALEKDASLIGKDYVRELKLSALSQGLSWTGFLVNSIRARKKGKNQLTVNIPGYGEALDKMRTHKVAFKKDPVLEKWVEEHKPLQPGGRYHGRGVIQVKRHPWIRKGLSAASRNISKRINNGNIVRTFRGGMM